MFFIFDDNVGIDDTDECFLIFLDDIKLMKLLMIYLYR